MQKSNTAGYGHIDLRALKFLALVLETRSVTLAGEELGLSQPAASRLLSQLRRALGDDPLVVRASGRYVLTERATAALPVLGNLLSIAELMFSAGSFDPGSSRKTFRVATTDYGAAVVLAPLASKIAEHAPGVSLDVHHFSGATFTDLEEGRLDFALYTDASLAAGFQKQHLFEESFACVVRDDHPILDYRDTEGQVPLQMLMELPRVLLTYPDGVRRAVDDPLTDLGDQSQFGSFLTPYFLAGPMLVRKSEHVLCMGKRVAMLIAETARVQVIDFPPAGNFAYCLIWHDRTDLDPASMWLRKQLRALRF
ncbi:LysR family transcriptional regulator [Agrobacterium vitis]|uniref:LysR family transcriptional regulator n=1 Tax=Agrobacterium vitis TaxID=373 RepID=UPI0015723E3B|nr:LysR family transcriptional regulator [Agrobacterium vitis]NSY14906.1 LysR family transcriptional regulator [Agrobacterium vitis]NSY24663.1 LysR family transcriptional regulator [Agrobacterium vitis]WEO75288.1 LysR family transcriptional regulator [Agrobacterium vitis]